jgi:hypothetical protein
MNEKSEKKQWYKKWWVWVIIGVVVVGSYFYSIGNDEEKEKLTDDWTTVIEFNGNLSDSNKEAISNIFELNGNQIRVTYSIATTETTGTALIYILPEGRTKSTDVDGNLDIAIQDVSTIGNKTNEQKTFTKDAGKYFIDINSSSVESYKIKIEEKNN